MDSRLGKTCGFQTEDNDNLCGHSLGEEAIVPNAEDHLMPAMAVEKVLHRVCTDDLPYRREYLVAQMKMTHFAACQAEAEGLLASSRNALAAITVFGEGG